jgi:putative inorganic carbon (hco3(-)) transporter
LTVVIRRSWTTQHDPIDSSISSLGTPLSIVVVLLVSAVGAALSVAVGGGIDWVSSLAPKYLVAGALASVLCAILIAALGGFERGLFALFVLSLPVRASLQLGTPPAAIAPLLNIFTPSGNPAWIGYPLGAPSIWLSDIPLALLWLLAAPRLVMRPATLPVPIVQAAGLLLVAEGLSVLSATQRDLALWGVVETAKAVAGAAYVVYRTRTRSDLDLALNLLSLAVVAQAAIAVAQFLTDSTLGVTFAGVDWASTLEGGTIRPSGTFAHPQMLAMYVGPALPLLIALSLQLQGARRQWPRILAAAGAGIALILTFSRMGWLASAIAVGVVLLASYGRALNRRLVVPVIGLAGLLLAASMPLRTLIARNITLERMGSELNVIADLYRVAFDAIRANPLTGVGLNNFSFVMGHYDRTGIAAFYPAPVHNLFVLLWAETGPLGLLGAAAACGVPAFAIASQWRRLDRPGRARAAGFLGGILVILLLSATGWTYFTVQPQVWFFLGLALAFARAEQAIVRL